MTKKPGRQDYRTCEQVAALPWRIDDEGSLKVLLVTSRLNGKWMLPKGWPMSDRSPAEAALQEAREEAGIEGVVGPSPLGSYRYMKLFSSGLSKPSRALIFSVRVISQMKTWDEKGARQRKWVRPGKAAALVHEPDLARFLSNLNAGRVLVW